MKHILIIGATSAMAEHCARGFAADGERLSLVARNADRLTILADDLRVRGASAVSTYEFPSATASEISQLIDHVDDDESIDIALIAHGVLTDQEEANTDLALVETDLQTNFNSPVLFAQAIAEKMADQHSGTLGIISSVAGLRGRQSNYIYGCTKAGLIACAAGLRNRVFERGVRVVAILPGFVDSPMTADIPKNSLFISAEKAGMLIHRSLTTGRSDVVYVPFFWRFILWIIRCIPEPLFKRLSL